MMAVVGSQLPLTANNCHQPPSAATMFFSIVGRLRLWQIPSSTGAGAGHLPSKSLPTIGLPMVNPRRRFGAHPPSFRPTAALVRHG